MPDQRKPTLNITGTLTLDWGNIDPHTTGTHETIRVTGITEPIPDNALWILVELARHCGHLDLEYDTDGLDLVERLTPLIERARITQDLDEQSGLPGYSEYEQRAQIEQDTDNPADFTERDL